MSITIDKEFEALIPPLSPDEFQQLEENCVNEGIRDALITWNGILIDGHNRFRIAAKHGLKWTEKQMEFPDRDAAKQRIILNQFGRRNLSAYDRSVLALKLKPIIAEKAKENQANHTEQGYQKSDKPVTTAKELAKVAGVLRAIRDGMSGDYALEWSEVTAKMILSILDMAYRLSN